MPTEKAGTSAGKALKLSVCWRAKLLQHIFFIGIVFFSLKSSTLTAHLN